MIKLAPLNAGDSRRREGRRWRSSKASIKAGTLHPFAGPGQGPGRQGARRGRQDDDRRRARQDGLLRRRRREQAAEEVATRSRRPTGGTSRGLHTQAPAGLCRPWAGSVVRPEACGAESGARSDAASGTSLRAPEYEARGCAARGGRTAHLARASDGSVHRRLAEPARPLAAPHHRHRVDRRVLLFRDARQLARRLRRSRRMRSAASSASSGRCTAAASTTARST